MSWITEKTQKYDDDDDEDDDDDDNDDDDDVDDDDDDDYDEPASVEWLGPDKSAPYWNWL